MLHELFNYKEIIAVALVACIAYFWKRSPGLRDDLSPSRTGPSIRRRF
jgi:hypothetical protein